MITGLDTVFVARGPAGPAVERFLGRWLERWPGMRVASAEEGADGVFAPWAPGVLDLSGTSGSLLVARDERMEADWDDTGYALDHRGEGPLYLAFEPVGRPVLRVSALEDPYGDSGFRYEPYEVALVGAGLCLVTAVTPEDVPFSRAVRDALVEAFAG